MGKYRIRIDDDDEYTYECDAYELYVSNNGQVELHLGSIALKKEPEECIDSWLIQKINVM